ncbi:glycosyltransferase family 39 protein [Pontibacter sp. E15-1]|uniref:ArnT family glycosyltransferase n=1 Tax=Pontibacter sp. E15-1 TaxID=2919918 RepID=UPI001F4F7CC4|nr:glycosyltransferase family 39 protein [Pontibacter sp. E15-1]MCJ8165369.1 glycosyltransferase family 39 protein [Pontibacter sp. E15-1]
MLESDRLRSSQLLYGLLFVFFLLLLYNAGGWGVIETSEARYAEISREMLRSGDWLHPRLLGIQHFHKPPVTYMLSAFGMELFGVNPFGARFFLQVSLVLQALLVYLIGQLLFRNSKQALIAVVVYITMPAVLISARNLTTDSFLTTFELAAIWAWLRYKSRYAAGWLYLFYLLLAIAFLTKGPVGLIFPALVAIGYQKPAVSGYTKGRNAWHHLPAVLLFLLVGASWYGYLIWEDPKFFDYFFLKHTVQRYANPEAFGRSKPWWFYIVLAPALSLPWAAILAVQYKKLREPSLPQKRLFILWLLLPLVFFSFSSSKLILYILPLFAGMALLMAWLLTNLAPKAVKKAAAGSLVFFAVLAVALLVAPVLPVGIRLPWAALLYPVLMLAILFLLWRSDALPLNKLLLSSLAFTLLLLPYSTHLLGNNPGMTNGSTHIANLITARKLQDRNILVYDKLLPSLAFELDKQLITLHNKNNDLVRETQFERDEAWRSLLLELGQPDDLTRVKALLERQPVLVVRNELPPEQAWMARYFQHKQKVGKWVVYY